MFPSSGEGRKIISVLGSLEELTSVTKVKLGAEVSRPACLGVRHPSGTHNQTFMTVRQLRVCSCGVSSLCLLSHIIPTGEAVLLRIGVAMLRIDIATDTCRLVLLRVRPIVEVEVDLELTRTLRLTVSQSVCLGVRHPFGAHDQILLFPFVLQENCFAFRLGAPSLMRGRVCNL
jgi:hypothetical protein